MKVIILNKEEQKYFIEMDPMMLLARGSFGRNFVLGAVEEEGGNDIPVGLAICSENEDSLYILWLCIASRFRKKGYGSELLDMIVRLSQKRGKKFVGAYFEESFLRKSICLGEKEYFREHGFDREYKLPGEWYSDVKTYLKQPCFAEADKNIHTNALGDFPKNYLYGYMQELINDGKTSFVSQIEDRSKEFDEDVSRFIIDKNNHVRGAILVDVLDDVLYPVAFLAGSKEEQLALMSSALNAAEKKYGKDMPVHIILLRDSCAEMMNSIFPDNRIENCLMLAEVERLLDFSKDDDSYADPFADISDAGLSEMAEIEAVEPYLKAGEDREISLKEFSEISFIKTDELPSQVESIGSLNLRRFIEVIVDCAYYGYSGAFECSSQQLRLEWFEPELSCCMLDNGRVTNLLLIHETADGELRPLMLFSKGTEYQQNLLYLMHYAAIRAQEQYPDDTVIKFRCHDAMSTAICERIIGKRQ